MSGLYEVKPFQVPLATDHVRLVQHAQRIATLTEAYAAALPLIPLRERQVYADVMPLGVAMSWGIDLRLLHPGGVLTWKILRDAAWPGSNDFARMRAAVAADAPRYEAGNDWARCPVRGSRGGVCHERGARTERWVTNLETGDWVHRDVCDLHRPIAVQRREASPEPAPNRGGVLAAVFPEADLPYLYGWAMPHWKPPAEVVERPAGEPVRREFRLVLGDAS